MCRSFDALTNSFSPFTSIGMLSVRPLHWQLDETMRPECEAEGTQQRRNKISNKFCGPHHIHWRSNRESTIIQYTQYIRYFMTYYDRKVMWKSRCLCASTRSFRCTNISYIVCAHNVCSLYIYTSRFGQLCSTLANIVVYIILSFIFLRLRFVANNWRKFMTISVSATSKIRIKEARWAIETGHTHKGTRRAHRHRRRRREMNRTFLILQQWRWIISERCVSRTCVTVSVQLRARVAPDGTHHITLHDQDR